MSKVYLIRHGKTALNGESNASSPDKIRGWTDVPLTEEGKEDAKRVASELKGLRPVVIYSSDLKRASDTAWIIFKKCGSQGEQPTAFIESKRFRPWNLGQFQGKETSQVIDRINEHIENEAEPVPGGESFETFRTRFLGEFKKILDRAAKETQPLFVVAHYRNTKIATAWDKAGRPDDLSIDKEEMEKKDGAEPGDYIVFEAGG